MSTCSQSRFVEWQWPDGGWNCDKKASGHRSSFNESLPPMWGLHEYWTATGETEAHDAAERTAELFLEHRLFRALATGEPIRESFVTLHSPPFWHYDFLQALVVLARMGLADDPRAADALDLLEERRLPDGRWRAGGRWWRSAGLQGQQRRGGRLGLRAERAADAARAPRAASQRPLLHIAQSV